MNIKQYVLPLAVFAVFALAGCGGGSSAPEEPEMAGPTPEQMAMKRAETQRADLKKYHQALNTAIAALSSEDVTDADISFANKAIADLQGAIDAAGDISADELASYRTAVSGANGSVTEADGRLKMAKEKAEEMAAKDRMAMARKLYNALAPVTATTSDGNQALADEDTDDINVSGQNLTASADSNNTSGDTAEPITIKRSNTSVANNAGWKGADYLSKIEGVTHHVVMYNNQDSSSEAFNKKHLSRLTATSDSTIGNEKYEINQTNLTASKEFIMGRDFAANGTESHTDGSTDDDGKKVDISGTFDGVSGTYSCTQVSQAACTSMVDGDDEIVLVGGWAFSPSSLTAMTSTMDQVYLAYGWWTRETSSGVVDVRAFANTQGATAVLSGNTAADTINGEATYTGGAAGKYAIYNPLGDNSSAGAFTAKATLEADFTNDKISGELTDFRSDGESMNWEVSLNVGDGPNITGTGGIGSDDSTADTYSTTTWTMDETSSDAEGSWSGDFYKSNGGTATTEPDATTAPAAVTGTFTAMYDVGGLNIGQMVGAFGANKVED